MASSKRERELARAHYERQQARRAQHVDRKRRRRRIIAASLAVLIAVGAGTALTFAIAGGDDDTASTAAQDSPSTPASPSSSPSAQAARLCPQPSGAAAKPQTYPSAPPLTINTKAAHTAKLQTNCGGIAIALDAAKAPTTVNSFAFLAGKGYFDGSKCHRITTEGIYVLQCGDPTGTGTGGPGYTFGVENAPADGKYPAGTVAMARQQDPKTNGSQFFIVYKDTQLPTDSGGYTIFGKVTSGLDVVEKVASAGSADGSDGAPSQPISLQKVTTTEQS